jgi:hypothetical protein
MIVSLRDMFFKDLSLVLTDRFIVDRYRSVLFLQLKQIMKGDN